MLRWTHTTASNAHRSARRDNFAFGSAAAVADRALAALAEPVAARRRVEAAHRYAAGHDAPAMLRQYAGLLRAAVAL